ncbi:ABC transporter ATP-binding protein [Segetibacter aerophilus]|uniref:ABC transporter ATP-binding protein n=1 Tax=Segetibacter aerophilus TaxID=670293 RepID=A0A512B6K7_9BACT|nr:ABC transporter ATP-binding protein [Segetibacter aerophilus]GEO07604.1 ABC transporter ATP-binding protein [Segetibacter aerophilus]
MSTVIKVENLSKQYRLGQVGTGSLAHDLNRFWHRMRGKEDPYLKIGEINDRSVKGSSEYVWALKDINFEVKHGEVLGIIGRNGAGKSTLLKILSRTTTPTTGSVKLKGRVASLLEVGTGFHPELSGRENIFLNGAILGMTKHEIKSKFDEIVDFSGVDRYIDTPVKRYSSGMYVRLAFAVAAFLEPDILIIDEVLAVGDAEFQKKALGKMKDVSNKEGRTVLFVSHNMTAVEALCENVVIIEKGTVKYTGHTIEGIKDYLRIESDKGTFKVATQEFEWLNFYSKPQFDANEDLEFQIEFNSRATYNELFVDCAIVNEKGDIVIHIKSDTITSPHAAREGKVLTNFLVESPKLVPGNYSITIYAYNKSEVLFWGENIVGFKINSKSFFGNRMFIENNRGVLLPRIDVTFQQS